MPEHIVKAYDEQLKRLAGTIARMGGLAEAQIADAIEALVKRNTALASTTVESDAKVDELERDIDNQAIQLLALRQPVAGDLRRIVAALRIASDLERIADYAANVAKRAVALAQVAPVRPLHAVPRMGKVVREMVKDVLDAYANRDVDKAIAVWNRDEELDDMHSSLFRELLTYMMEDPRNITASTHLLFIAKNIERIGDHATNIAETIHFLVVGTPLKGSRPKGDMTSFAVVQPKDGGAR
ncbi:MAG: phosphate signaling complex protein PhoU [Rhodospirillales bacterium]|nr:phosphate signaling complex protein PhoU [Rhodospirillales bacterium]